MNAITYCKNKVHGFFTRIFKEQAGGAELIATLVIIGIVLVLAFAFKDQLTGLVKSIWNNLIASGNEDTGITEVASTWE